MYWKAVFARRMARFGSRHSWWMQPRRGHLWAERYDRDLKDIFALQDEVAQKIVAALAVKLTEDEQERLGSKYTENMEAYDFYLQGRAYQNRFTKEAHVKARQMFERAIDLDPEFAAAYGWLGFTHFP